MQHTTTNYPWIIILFSLAYVCLSIAAGMNIGKALKAHVKDAYPFTEPPGSDGHTGPTDTAKGNSDENCNHQV